MQERRKGPNITVTLPSSVLIYSVASSSPPKNETDFSLSRKYSSLSAHPDSLAFNSLLVCVAVSLSLSLSVCNAFLEQFREINMPSGRGSAVRF
jgi:hypothetical protein